MRKSDHGRALGPEKLCPYRVALEVIVGKKPPDWVRGNLSKLQEADHVRLIEWIGANIQGDMWWVTLHGVIDAVCLLVQDAESNGNFKNARGYDVKYRTVVEQAEEAEKVLGGASTQEGWHPYTLRGPINFPMRQSLSLMPGAGVYVRRAARTGAVQLRVLEDGPYYTIDAPTYLEGIDSSRKKNRRQPL